RRDLGLAPPLVTRTSLNPNRELLFKRGDYQKCLVERCMARSPLISLGKRCNGYAPQRNKNQGSHDSRPRCSFFNRMVHGMFRRDAFGVLVWLGRADDYRHLRPPLVCSLLSPLLSRRFESPSRFRIGFGVPRNLLSRSTVSSSQFSMRRLFPLPLLLL